jgi:ribosome biogenesis GTPase A
MVNYWQLVNKVIDESGVILLVIDARMPEETRHKEIEQKIGYTHKKLLYVINKCDLIRQDEAEELKKKFQPSVFVSSTKKLGGTILLKKIKELSQNSNCIVGVLGYPNVGKSSVINLLKGKKSASVSPHSGHTKGVQFIKAKSSIKLIDTPGVLPFGEDDLMKEVVIGSKNPEHLKEPDFFAMKLIEMKPEMFEKFYGVKYENDAFDFLEAVSKKRNVLVKGGGPDMQRMARQMLYDWQRGRIHEFCINTTNK